MTGQLPRYVTAVNLSNGTIKWSMDIVEELFPILPVNHTLSSNLALSQNGTTLYVVVVGDPMRLDEYRLTSIEASTGLVTWYTPGTACRFISSPLVHPSTGDILLAANCSVPNNFSSITIYAFNANGERGSPGTLFLLFECLILLVTLRYFELSRYPLIPHTLRAMIK